MAAVLICPVVGAERWVSVLFAVALAVSFVTFVAAYVWFAVKTPDALRSERYSLVKLSIEKSATGDNRIGFADPDEAASSLPAADATRGQERLEADE